MDTKSPHDKGWDVHNAAQADHHMRRLVLGCDTLPLEEVLACHVSGENIKRLGEFIHDGSRVGMSAFSWG